jgi:hypothetical protein
MIIIRSKESTLFTLQHRIRVFTDLQNRRQSFTCDDGEQGCALARQPSSRGVNQRVILENVELNTNKYWVTGAASFWWWGQSRSAIHPCCSHSFNVQYTIL